MESLHQQEQEHQQEYNVVIHTLHQKVDAFYLILGDELDDKFQRMEILNDICEFLLNKIYIFHNSPFMPGNINFVNTVIDRMIHFLNEDLLQEPAYHVEGANRRDLLVRFKANCLLTKHEYKKVKCYLENRTRLQ